MEGGISRRWKESARERSAPGLVVSYADLKEGHVGTIYQATNWIYLGGATQPSSKSSAKSFTHARSMTDMAEEARASTGCAGTSTPLRPVQKLSTHAILDGANCVVLAPTAGSKTEAALFPVLSRMDREDAHVGRRVAAVFGKGRTSQALGGWGAGKRALINARHPDAQLIQNGDIQEGGRSSACVRGLFKPCGRPEGF